MSKVIITDTNRFEGIISELEKTIPEFEDVFSLQDKNFSKIDGTDNYRGRCQEVISGKYNTVKKNYQSIDEALRNYIKFLKITVKKYKDYELAMDKTIDKNDEELDVN